MPVAYEPRPFRTQSMCRASQFVTAEPLMILHVGSNTETLLRLLLPLMIKFGHLPSGIEGANPGAHRSEDLTKSLSR